MGNYHTITVPDDVERAVRADKGVLYGGDPDVSRFFKRGGKLLMYHGWADPLVSPDTSVMMFKRINDAVGSSAANSLALFMVPGMGHCQGGPGTDADTHLHRGLRQEARIHPNPPAARAACRSSFTQSRPPRPDASKMRYADRWQELEGGN